MYHVHVNTCTNQDLAMRILFMGSPQEVVSPLQQLLASGDDLRVVAVVSQPARPVGRSGKLQDPPLAEFAKARGLTVMQPESARDPEFLEALRDLRPDVIVTAAYGQILSKKFLSIPRRGTINIHPSILPKYRGATPVPAALLNGDKVTGVSVLFTVKALDAGAIICAKEAEVLPAETADALTRRMFDIGGGLLIEALGKLRDPAFAGTPQDDAAATYCGKIEKSDGAVDWLRPAVVTCNRFRAFYPWPGTFTFFNGKRVSILDAREAVGADLGRGAAGLSDVPGSFVFSKASKGILARTADGILVIARLQNEGGKPVDAAAFWNGIKDRASCRFGVAGEGES
jgi:methionyl-tRNA formyltransferase